MINIFSIEELSTLDFAFKTNLLDEIYIKGGWIQGNWLFNEINDEEAVLRVMKSIVNPYSPVNTQYTDANDFLDYLLEPIAPPRPQTRFESFWDSVQDDVFLGDDGNGNRGQMIKTILKIWSLSKYNPYRLDPNLSDEQVANEALSHFTYTSLPAHIVNEQMFFEEADPEGAPMLIEYESKRSLLWVLDDFSFEFSNGKIVVNKSIVPGGRLPTGNDGTVNIFYSKLYGTYDILQPIAIGKTAVNENNQYLVTMPFKPVEGQQFDVNRPNTDFLSNCFPIFYLMYLDGVAEYSNTKETIGIALDLVLTVSGIGNIPKLRHLRYSKNIFRKFISSGFQLSALTSKERFLVTTLSLQLVESVNLFVGGLSILHKLLTGGCAIYHTSGGQPPQKPAQGDPDYDAKLEAYEKYVLCKNIDAFLTAVELLLLVGTFRAARNARMAAARLKSEKPSNLSATDSAANDFIDSIKDLDDLLEDFMDVLKRDHSEVHKRVSKFEKIENGEIVIDKEKQFAFFGDAQDNPNFLGRLQTDPDLIKYWEEVEHLLKYRKELQFLENYRIIKSNTKLQKHVHLGDAELIPTKDATGKIVGTTKAHVTGYHNSSALIGPPPGPGQVSWKFPPKNSKPNDPRNGYIKGKIERNMYDKIDERTGKPWLKGNIPFPDPPNPLHPNHLSTKSHKTVVWPVNYSKQRINEEMANVMSNMNKNQHIIKGPDKSNVLSYVYRGTATDGKEIEVMYYGGDFANGQLISIYPTYNF